MPYANLGATRLFYMEDGQADAPVLVLSNSLGTSAAMWAPQLPVLCEHFRVIRYDTRGHGKSAIPEGEYTFTQLADDLVGLLDHLEIERAHFCGLSMGGATGMQFALAHPQRLNKLVLCNTAARIGSAEGWLARVAAVGESGLDALAPGLVERWLTAEFREREPVQTRQLVDMLRRTSDAGYSANCAALRDADFRGLVGKITAPTMVIAGQYDLAATLLQGRELAAAISGARFVELAAAHLSNWEQAGAFNEALVDFLAG